ncbi:MAG: type II toxin-antitoxin system HicB family antitoxin, partial [Thermotogae bacterium]
ELMKRIKEAIEAYLDVQVSEERIEFVGMQKVRV